MQIIGVLWYLAKQESFHDGKNGGRLKCKTSVSHPMTAISRFFSHGTTDLSSPAISVAMGYGPSFARLINDN
jgi:hypothetical protein